MRKAGEILVRHKNLFLLTLLVSTLVISSHVQRQRLENSSVTTELPVMSVSAPTGTASTTFAKERESAYQRELSALKSLCEQESLDSKTRQAAADQLQELIANHDAQQAIATALASSGLAPCTVVLANGSLTIITEKATFPDADASLALTLAHAHAGVAPEHVRIIPGESP